MTKRRGPKSKSIPMKIGNDPALWRYSSLQEALKANTDLIARIIRAGEERTQAGKSNCETFEAISLSEQIIWIPLFFSSTYPYRIRMFGEAMIKRIEFSLNLEDPREAAIYRALKPALRYRRAGAVIRQALDNLLVSGQEEEESPSFQPTNQQESAHEQA